MYYSAAVEVQAAKKDKQSKRTSFKDVELHGQKQQLGFSLQRDVTQQIETIDRAAVPPCRRWRPTREGPTEVLLNTSRYLAYASLQSAPWRTGSLPRPAISILHCPHEVLAET